MYIDRSATVFRQSKHLGGARARVISPAQHTRGAGVSIFRLHSVSIAGSSFMA